MAKLIAVERQNRIVEVLNQNGSCKLAELAELLGVSKETIRRDLIHLNEIGAVKKSHGGVSLPFELKTKSMATRIASDYSLKTKICKKALEYIHDGSVIYLDTGSTIACLAELLRSKHGLTIITNSLSAANALVNSNHIVHLTGGQLNSLNMSLEGYQTNSFLSTVKVELAFFGTNGFEEHTGPTTCDFLDVESKQTVLQNSKMNIVVTESSKSKTTSLTRYTSWHNIDYIITDDDIDASTIENLNELTSVVTVQSGNS